MQARTGQRIEVALRLGCDGGTRIGGQSGAWRGGRLLAWAVLAPWAGWALLRALGLERGFPLVALMALTPYVALLAVVPLAAALLLRQRAAGAAALVVAAVLAAGVVPRALPSRPPALDGPELRVLTANLYYGQAAPPPWWTSCAVSASTCSARAGADPQDP